MSLPSRRNILAGALFHDSLAPTLTWPSECGLDRSPRVARENLWTTAFTRSRPAWARRLAGTPQPPKAGAAATPSPEARPFRFTGKTSEFFGIWIVNLFLTIVTLGIYSAWAKARKKRYLYGHTWVADANF
ncbi:MAG: DUF898 family protein [Betaproteobacteria bacterium]|nr:DUF898 family protein [Betaproteobacteria bacterium]